MSVWSRKALADSGDWLPTSREMTTNSFQRLPIVHAQPHHHQHQASRKAHFCGAFSIADPSTEAIVSRQKFCYPREK